MKYYCRIHAFNDNSKPGTKERRLIINNSFERDTDMNPPFGPLTLGDIFEKTFLLIGKTFLRNILVSFIILLLPSIIIAFATGDFYSSIIEMRDSDFSGRYDSGLDKVIEVFSMLSFFWMATLIYALAVLMAEIAVSIIVSEELGSNHITFMDALKETFSIKCLYGLGQAVVKYAALIGGIIVAISIFVILGAVSKVLTGIIGFIAIIIAMPFAVYIMIKWYFSLTAVAVDDLTVIESLRRSWHLVKGYWWRTFGIILLLSILAQFVISIVSLPITFGSMWDFYREYFTLFGKTGGEVDPAVLLDLQKSYGPEIAIGSGISALLSLLITPVFTVVMYYDLRARENPVGTSALKLGIEQNESSGPIDLSKI
ncbi:MAG: hypothetical protein JXA06_12395 [Bacteroidetes bacterium]|nr:hypothetical protein [Bacteroidota bacterium]